ncbi:MAG: hypothetical protein JWR00_2070 [Rubritepida sp.]|nr:hypothetical protein [Rubritepida sp.]
MPTRVCAGLGFVMTMLLLLLLPLRCPGWRCWPGCSEGSASSLGATGLSGQLAAVAKATGGPLRAAALRLPPSGFRAFLTAEVATLAEAVRISGAVVE